MQGARRCREPARTGQTIGGRWFEYRVQGPLVAGSRALQQAGIHDELTPCSRQTIPGAGVGRSGAAQPVERCGQRLTGVAQSPGIA